MTDSDDLLTLPVEGDDTSGPRAADGLTGHGPAGGVLPGSGAGSGFSGAALSGNAPPGHALSGSGAAAGLPASMVGARNPLMSSGGELVSLSSEARLATALLLQAQALEGMRQAHSDLLRRLDDGGGSGGGSARRAVDDLQATLREVQQGQQRALGQLSRARRRATQRNLVLSAAIVVVALGLAWLVQTSRDQVGRDIAGISGTAATDRAALQQSLGATLKESGARQTALLEQLAAEGNGTEAMLRDELKRAGAERDAAREELAGKSQAAAALATELAAAHQQQQALEEDLRKARDDRNRQIGEAGRLRDQVADRDRQLAELADTMSKLRADLDARKAAPDGKIAVAATDPKALAVRVTAALHASGAARASVMEAGPVVDGSLTDVLVMLIDDSGKPGRVLRAAKASLLVEHGRALLRLDGVVLPGDGKPAAGEDIVLPALDADAWRALGLVPPAGFVPIPKIAEALGVLLAPQGYRVIHLDSFDGSDLGGLELRQEDARGELLRSLTAARAQVLPVGPELVLEDGSIKVGDDVRPFFQGECRVPLAGADFGAWLASVAGNAP